MLQQSYSNVIPLHVSAVTLQNMFGLPPNHYILDKMVLICTMCTLNASWLVAG